MNDQQIIHLMLALDQGRVSEVQDTLDSFVISFASHSIERWMQVAILARQLLLMNDEEARCAAVKLITTTSQRQDLRQSDLQFIRDAYVDVCDLFIGIPAEDEATIFFLMCIRFVIQNAPRNSDHERALQQELLIRFTQLGNRLEQSANACHSIIKQELIVAILQIMEQIATSNPQR